MPSNPLKKTKANPLKKTKANPLKKTKGGSGPDAIVIGSGSAGLTVAMGLARLGRSAILVESGHVGGDCTNVGCIPSKSLLHHSQISSSAGTASRSGSDVLGSVRKRRDHLRDEETAQVKSLAGLDFRAGQGRINGEGQVAITAADGSTSVVRAKHVVIATGSTARRIPVPGLPEDRYLTNEELFEITQEPQHLVIVGAGPIGLEMATAFSRLGSEVTVLEAAPRVMPSLLPEASRVAQHLVEATGAVVKPGLVAKRYDPATNELHIGPVQGSETEVLANVDRVLVAAGRVPNSSGLGLEEAGVVTDSGGRVVIDERGQSSVKGIWAAGDVTTEGGTTHAATIWGRRIIKGIIAPYGRAGNRPITANTTFTSPEIANIGTQSEVPAKDVRRLRADPADADRGYTDEIPSGLILVDVRRFSGKILGATIIGPRAGELISVFSLAMKNDIPLNKFYGTVWPYPSYSDAINLVVDEHMTETLQNIPSDAGQWLRGRASSLFRS